jgi:UDP-N-acetylglucosamine 4-epimerase
MDNFSTGKLSNLREVEENVGSQSWQRFKFVQADIRDAEACMNLTSDVDYVLHQAALGSVPLSIDDPRTTHDVNVTGFTNMLLGAKINKVRRFIYASSCAVYGDNTTIPIAESASFRPLSPYAATKACNELYAQSFHRSYALSNVGLRYFNVYGERQDPSGAYAAVIPRWIHSILQGERLIVHGDGENSRDFVYVGTVVDANIAAALLPQENVCEVFNVASGDAISLNQLLSLLQHNLMQIGGSPKAQAMYEKARLGDIRYSAAEVSYLSEKLRLEPVNIQFGIKRTLDWHFKQSNFQ